MGLREIIKKRKSVRKYKNKEIPEELIKEIVDAARLAPSACNAQPTRYFVVKDKETKDRLKEAKIFKQNFVYKAPVIIVCCGDPKAYPRSGRLEPGYDEPYEVRVIKDIAIATQNLVLRATELGLGTCYVGWMHKERVKEILGIPEYFVVPFSIVLGYSNEKPKETSRKNLEEIILSEF